MSNLEDLNWDDAERFIVSPEAWDQLQDMLDAEPRESPKLRALFERTPPWDDEAS